MCISLYKVPYIINSRVKDIYTTTLATFNSHRCTTFASISQFTVSSSEDEISSELISIYKQYHHQKTSSSTPKKRRKLRFVNISLYSLYNITYKNDIFIYIKYTYITIILRRSLQVALLRFSFFFHEHVRNLLHPVNAIKLF